MATTQAAPGKKGLINFDFLQKLGKVLMTVIAVMPAAAATSLMVTAIVCSSLM